VTTPDPQEAALNALMIRVSREVVGVFDSSKFGQRSLSVIAPLSALGTVVTDAGADARCLKALKARGVSVQLA
jgi:DeoR family transcriptional regulator of aga operon